LSCRQANNFCAIAVAIHAALALICRLSVSFGDAGERLIAVGACRRAGSGEHGAFCAACRTWPAHVMLFWMIRIERTAKGAVQVANRVCNFKPHDALLSALRPPWNLSPGHLLVARTKLAVQMPRGAIFDEKSLKIGANAV
jgi:hypothetical protein